MSKKFSVSTQIDCADASEVEHYDLTADVDSHWHITSSGYDQYLWCGEEETGTYDDGWNDVVLLLDGKVGDDLEDRVSHDWTGTPTQIWWKDEEYAEVETGFDYGMIEINPAVTADTSQQWYYYDPLLTPPAFFDDFEAQPMFAPLGPPWAFTMGWVWGPGGDDAFALPYGFMPPWMTPVGGSGAQYGGESPDIAPVPMWALTECDTPTIDYSPYPSFIIQYNVQAYIGHLNAGNAVDGLFWGGTYDDLAWIDVYDGTGYQGDVVTYQGDATGVETYVLEPAATFTDPTTGWFDFGLISEAIGGMFASGFAFDDVGIYVNTLGGTGDHGWLPYEYDLRPEYFRNAYTGGTFATEIGGFTADMGIRLRFFSDPGTHERGWLLEDISILNDLKTDELFGPDPCDDMDNFHLDTVHSGDWWFEDIVLGGWTCQDQILGAIPHDVDNPLVWDTAIPQAYYAKLSFTHEASLETGKDYAYIELSTDGGSTWIAPVAFTGTFAASPIELDVSSFAGSNVLIRWRVETNNNVLSTYYNVRDICIHGYVDTEPPMTTGELSGTMLHGWYSSPVTFTATATDDISGVAATYYKIDGGSSLTYTAPLTISANGEHYIEYWSVDNVGNEEVHHTTPTFKIDTGSAPSVAITAPTDGLYLFGNKLLSMSGKIIIIGGFTVEATASDADSGVYRVQFDLDGAMFGEATSAPYSAYCGEKHTGAGTITATAEDFTGQTASASISITYFKFL